MGAGLGHKFLKHIERTKVLLHIIDASRSVEEVLEDHRTIEQELSRYKEVLLKRRMLVILNKMDLVEDRKKLEKIIGLLKKKDISVLAISALTGSGIDALKNCLLKTLETRYDE